MMIPSMQGKKKFELTPIEKYIHEAICVRFKDVPAIAAEMNRSPSTVTTHVHRIRQFLQVKNNLEMVAVYWQERSAGDREFKSWGA